MDVGTAIASSFSAGISMYGVLALLGIAGRLDWIEAPELLERPAVIGVCVALFLVELVVDKIAWLDSVWDVVHTFLRPVAGAAIMAIAPDQTLPVPVALAVGGALALTSHGAKASTRALVNASPEPASNVVVSPAEDGLVAVLMALAIANPVVAGVLTTILFVCAIGVILAARHLLRRLKRKWRDRRRPPPSPPPEVI
ncbi:MAG TPA: DUF4126 domain-containing protein [Acidimicrobiales bacterium]|nr:DUF4126 domain-containing protein [Acidimicrobiales bacterium]